MAPVAEEIVVCVARISSIWFGRRRPGANQRQADIFSFHQTTYGRPLARLAGPTRNGSPVSIKSFLLFQAPALRPLINWQISSHASNFGPKLPDNTDRRRTGDRERKKEGRFVGETEMKN